MCVCVFLQVGDTVNPQKISNSKSLLGKLNIILYSNRLAKIYTLWAYNIDVGCASAYFAFVYVNNSDNSI